MPVVEMPLGPELRMDPDTVLNAAVGKYRHVVVIGLRPDGEVDIAGSPRLSETTALIEYARRSMNYELIRTAVEDGDG